jgi:flagellar hook-basal body complex protein FliE
MSLSITPVRMPAGIPSLQPGASSSVPRGSFQSVLSDAIGRVQQSQNNSQSSIDKFLSGEDEEVHKVALATQQAELSFDLFLQVRNKVISAYQEVMRMQM